MTSYCDCQSDHIALILSFVWSLTSWQDPLLFWPTRLTPHHRGLNHSFNTCWLRFPYSWNRKYLLCIWTPVCLCVKIVIHKTIHILPTLLNSRTSMDAPEATNLPLIIGTYMVVNAHSHRRVQMNIINSVTWMPNGPRPPRLVEASSILSMSGQMTPFHLLDTSLLLAICSII